jgi:hypothetical protein
MKYEPFSKRRSTYFRPGPSYTVVCAPLFAPRARRTRTWSRSASAGGSQLKLSEP